MRESSIQPSAKKIINLEEARARRTEKDEKENRSGNVIPIEEGQRIKDRRVEKNLLEKIELERWNVCEKFGDLITMVSDRYENLPAESREAYNNHNKDIIDKAMELGVRNDFSKENLQNLGLAAILHDMNKADEVPEEYADIPHYALATHAKLAAEAVPGILTDEYLKSKNIESDFDTVRGEVAKAILEHMGPRPGFMDRILEKFNEEMKKRGQAELDYPHVEGEVSEALLAADMVSLVGPAGWQKIFADRFSIGKFRKEDEATSKEYAKYGIDLAPGEAAILSAYASSIDALNMFSDEKNRKWIEGYLAESKKVAFSRGDGQEKVSWETVNEKREKYEAIKAVRAKLSVR